MALLRSILLVTLLQQAFGADQAGSAKFLGPSLADQEVEKLELDKELGQHEKEGGLDEERVDWEDNDATIQQNREEEEYSFAQKSTEEKPKAKKDNTAEEIMELKIDQDIGRSRTHGSADEERLDWEDNDATIEADREEEEYSLAQKGEGAAKRMQAAFLQSSDESSKPSLADQEVQKLVLDKEIGHHESGGNADEERLDWEDNDATVEQNREEEEYSFAQKKVKEDPAPKVDETPVAAEAPKVEEVAAEAPKVEEVASMDPAYTTYSPTVELPAYTPTVEKDIEPVGLVDQEDLAVLGLEKEEPADPSAELDKYIEPVQAASAVDQEVKKETEPTAASSADEEKSEAPKIEEAAAPKVEEETASTDASVTDEVETPKDDVATPPKDLSLSALSSPIVKMDLSDTEPNMDIQKQIDALQADYDSYANTQDSPQ